VESPCFSCGEYVNVNHDKKEFVRKSALRTIEDSEGSWKVHPLPILTADSNGAGGSYYPKSEEDEKYIGSWSGDRLSVEKEVPEGFVEIFPKFID
jgi:hypothetical protein